MTNEQKVCSALVVCLITWWCVFWSCAEELVPVVQLPKPDHIGSPNEKCDPQKDLSITGEPQPDYKMCSGCVTGEKVITIRTENATVTVTIKLDPKLPVAEQTIKGCEQVSEACFEASKIAAGAEVIAIREALELKK